MASKNVPLSQYLSPALIDFIDLPEGFFDQLGIVESRAEKQESITLGQEYNDAFFDPVEGQNLSATWTGATVQGHSRISFSLSNLKEQVFTIPGVDSIEFVLAATDSAAVSAFTVTLTTDNDDSYKLCASVSLKVRFDKSLLKPINKKTGTDGKLVYEVDKSEKKFEIEVGEVSLEVDSQGKFNLNVKAGLTIDKPAMIGDTGVILDDVKNISFNLDGSGSKPLKAPAGWKGFYIGKANVYIPDIMDGYIGATDLGVGSGGFYGEIKYGGGVIEG
ncbi:MAG: hypothetical protein OEQ53_18995, partial [Saprospiraceae bacterium]|nr:hypothetical protein [Saprospiraceae bacterium]